MATRLFFKNTNYRQNFYPATYNQGATNILCSQIRYDAGTGSSGAYFACDTLGSYSTDGIDWVGIGTGGPVGAANTMAYMLNNVWWLGSSTGVLFRLTSTDGVWTSVFTNSQASQWLDMIVANGYYVATAGSGILATSTNGTNWTANSSISSIFGTGNHVYVVTYSPSLNLFVAAGGGGLLATATDPTGTWTSRTSSFATSSIFYCVFSVSLSIFVAVGASGKIATSSNATTWTQRTSGIATTIFAIAVNGSQLVAGGANSVILRSTTGTSWTNAKPLPSEVTASSSSISHLYQGSAANEFWCVGGIALIYESTDNGVTWAAQGTETNPSAVSFSDNSTFWDVRTSQLREMNNVVGTAQVTLSNTLPAMATAITTFWGAWASRPLTAAATVGGGAITLNFAGLESSNASNWLGTNGLFIYIFRPSTNAVIGTVRTFTGTAAAVITEMGTSESARQVTGITSSAVSALAGDIVVVELWSTNTPGMASSFTNTFFYNGTTTNTTNLAAVTNHASFIEFNETFSIAAVATNNVAIFG